MQYDHDTWHRVEALKEEGLSDPAISRRTGIPRSTIYMHFVRQRDAPAVRQSEPEALAGEPIILAFLLAGCLIVSFLRIRRLPSPPEARLLPPYLESRWRRWPGSPRQDWHQSRWRPVNDR